MFCFLRSSLRLTHQLCKLYKLKPITSTSEMMWHLEGGRDSEVNWNCKKNYRFWQMDHKDRRMPDAPMHSLHICCTCTMWANGSFTIRGNAEFFGCGMRKAIRGNLRNVPRLIFRKLPPKNFLHSAKYLRPWRHAGVGEFCESFVQARFVLHIITITFGTFILFPQLILSDPGWSNTVGFTLKQILTFT